MWKTVITLGRKTGFVRSDTLLPSSQIRIQELCTDSACSSLTHFAEVIAKMKAVFIDRYFNSMECTDSNGAFTRASSTISRLNSGRRTLLEGRNHRAPLRKWIAKKCTTQKWQLNIPDWHGSAAVVQKTCKQVAARAISVDKDLKSGGTLASEQGRLLKKGEKEALF
ncbi:UNVERIFIED_CONTAM: hypothetical protein FKN15_071734 [Acipenser sinensis]